jgi:hypothetical protein
MLSLTQYQTFVDKLLIQKSKSSLIYAVLHLRVELEKVIWPEFEGVLRALQNAQQAVTGEDGTKNVIKMAFRRDYARHEYHFVALDPDDSSVELCNLKVGGDVKGAPTLRLVQGVPIAEWKVVVLLDRDELSLLGQCVGLETVMLSTKSAQAVLPLHELPPVEVATSAPKKEPKHPASKASMKAKVAETAAKPTKERRGPKAKHQQVSSDKAIDAARALLAASTPVEVDDSDTDDDTGMSVHEATVDLVAEGDYVDDLVPFTDDSGMDADGLH